MVISSWSWVGVVAMAGSVTGACSSSSNDKAGDGGSPGANGWAISSPAFKAGEPIPKEYTCDGRAFPVALASPELDWTAGPAGTKSYAIVVEHLAIVEGLDASDPSYFKGFMWVIWDIPSSVHALPANLSRAEFPAEIPGAQQWSIRNQFGYFAPCPNSDPAAVAGDPTKQVTNEYGFVLYALDAAPLALPARESGVTNYTWTLAKQLDAVSLGKTMLRATSDAVAGTAPVPVDATTLVYPPSVL